jgi:hypothetical protein
MARSGALLAKHCKRTRAWRWRLRRENGGAREKASEEGNEVGLRFAAMVRSHTEGSKAVSLEAEEIECSSGSAKPSSRSTSSVLGVEAFEYGEGGADSSEGLSRTCN